MSKNREKMELNEEEKEFVDVMMLPGGSRTVRPGINLLAPLHAKKAAGMSSKGIKGTGSVFTWSSGENVSNFGDMNLCP